jgi:hypothetical protein
VCQTKSKPHKTKNTKDKNQMFNFTISSFNPPANKHGLASSGMPWQINQEGVQKKEIDNCLINGIEMRPGERIAFTGRTSNSLSIATVKKFGERWEICLDWDGKNLTVFTEKEYVEQCSMKIVV